VGKLHPTDSSENSGDE
jgi:hypothetical protein